MTVKLKYGLPFSDAVPAYWDLVRGRRRSFADDSRRFVKSLPPIHLRGDLTTIADNPSGTVITINHFGRPGFLPMWWGIALQSLVVQEIHWVIAQHLTHPDLKVFPKTSGIVLGKMFSRIAGMYDFGLMPAMPPRPQDASARAVAMRRLLKRVRSTPGLVLGFAPEGTDSPQGSLRMPPAGVGRFLGALSREGMTLQPIATYEGDEGLWFHAGAPYDLEDEIGDHRNAPDSAISEIVMKRIATCFPDPPPIKPFDAPLYGT